MPDDLTTTPRRVVGRSKTHDGEHGKELVLTDALDRGYLCQKLCTCDAGTSIRNALGHELKQRCATASIWSDEEINQLVWRYKAEVGYNMMTVPPAPLMSAEQPNRPSRFPLGRAMGDGILKRGLEGPQKGLLRIPDCIILTSTGAELADMRASGDIDWDRLIPVKKNIETVLELKFAGDTLDRFQRKAYQRIAGPARFKLLKIGDCDCSAKRSAPEKLPVRVPVTTPMKRESEEQRPWYQSRPPSPSPAPAPQPQRPEYGPTSTLGEHVSLVEILRRHPLAAEIVLVGVMLLVLVAVRAGAVIAVGALAAAGTAAASPNGKKK